MINNLDKIMKLLFLLIIILFFFVYELPAETLRSIEKGNYNVIFVDVTCLRADHLSAYGYYRKTTPFIDNLISEGIWFKQAIAQGYWTLPSVASLLTSKYPLSHSVLARNQKLDDSFITITEILNQHGYKTSAFVGGLDLNSIHNLDQGFEVYSDETGENSTGFFSINFTNALEWIKKNFESKQFVYIQGYDIHPPFCLKPPYDHFFNQDYHGILQDVFLDYQFLKKIKNRKIVIEGKEIELKDEDIAHIIAHYDGGIRFVDELLEKFTNELKKMKLYDNTILVIFGDHGEELMDHGTFDRFGSENLYEEVIHVPLVIRHPDLKKIKINQPVELIDIAPTILSFLNLPSEKEMQGENLVNLIRDEINENSAKCTFAGWGKKQMVRSSDWKLIFNGGSFELYDLKIDPGESNNLINQNPLKAVDLSKRLFSWFINTRQKSMSKSLVIPTKELPEFWRMIYENKSFQFQDE